jgi:hypothetical protein
MQAVIERYEREMTRVPEAGDMLRISQPTSTPADKTRPVATVTPLPSDRSSAMNAPATAPVATPPPAAQAAVTSVPPGSSPLTPDPTPAPSAQSAVAPPPAATTPNPQPAPAEESWLGSVTGWLSSLWGWLFS